MGKSESVEKIPEIKRSLNFLIERSTTLRWCVTVGASWKSMSLALSYALKAGEATLSGIIHAGSSPLVSRCSWRSLNTWINFLIFISWGVSIYYCYHFHTKQIDTCLPYWKLQGIYLLGLWLFAYCGRWYWWTLCWCVVSVVSSVDSTLDIIDWWTWYYYLFGAGGPRMFPFMGLYDF